MSSKLRVLASVSLLALGTVAADDAMAANVPGIRQINVDTIAINLIDIDEAAPPTEFGAVETVTNAGGHALAEAFVLCAESATCSDPGAIAQFAHGSQSAANSILIDGSVKLGAEADAEGVSATAAAIILTGVWQAAGAEDIAENDIAIGGLLDIVASADALGTGGSAAAFAGIGAGVSQVATSISIDGTAANALSNSGDLTIAVNAYAEAMVRDAAATAFIGAGIYQQAAGQDSGSADIANSGSILIDASASAVADGIAVASAEAAGIVQYADARTEQFASTFTSGGLLIGSTTNTPSGPASGNLANSGSIVVNVEAAANGGFDAAATGVVLGVAQIISGSSAEASIDNSGSIDIVASVDAEGFNSPRGVVFVSGISQAATAYAFSTVETIDQNGVLTYELSTTPVGPAVASFTNSGDITVAGNVDVVAMGTTSMVEALGVAFVDGFDQYANGDGALATIDNSGSFTVVADVSVDSSGVSNPVAIATGIDQYASAYASQATIVFGNGTATTPTTWTGSATAIGSAAVELDNSGSLTVVASIDSNGDEMAFGGATASAIGQFAAGTDASATINNSGSIVSVGTLSSHADLAFGAAAAIGAQQGAHGTAAADILFDNAGDLTVFASAAAEGVNGAFVNATVFGAAQVASGSGTVNVDFDNSGSIDIAVIGNAVAANTTGFDMAMAFANAHGIGQLAEGLQANVEFVNSGTFEMLAQIEASAEEFAQGSATASGVIQQFAIGTASGTASASIDNSGEILVGAIADVAAGSTAFAVAGVRSAMVQAVYAGMDASAALTNSGSITMIADAEALAGGGVITDVGSAYAYVTGIYALASATGVSGVAGVDLSNEGSIEIAAMAHATGDGFARAGASAISGLGGTAIAAATDGVAEVSLTNDGSLSLIGAAEATGGYTAHATGIALRGMDAFVTGGGDATAELVNSGELNLVADAHASAGTNALAIAIAIDGLQETAYALDGEALATITNSGELNMLANATASALNAQAFAIVGGTFFTGAVFQSAAAIGGASAIFDNSGSLSVVADALANGEVVASASAVGGPGINQFVFVTGDGYVGIENTGSLQFVAHAEANATNSAYADAVFYNAVGQFANAAGGTGALNLTNDGTISVAVVAEANGDAVASALAIASHEVGQVAMAFDGHASAVLDNSGSIELGVAAIAEGEIAMAQAALTTGIIQWAMAFGDSAEGTFDNSGSIDISVAAQVEGLSFGTATAVLASAVLQTASTNVDEGAEATLDNSGSIDVGVVASAAAPEGAADAFAVLDGAVIQYAGAGSSQYAFGTTSGGMSSVTQHIFPTGPAGLQFDNSGSLDVAMAAAAEGGTSAIADATGEAVIQFARGLDASASLVNDGSVGIQAGVTAEAELYASANGSLTGIIQAASAAETTVYMVATSNGGQVTDVTVAPIGSVSVALDNSGTLDVVGIANATAATGSAGAGMVVQGILQDVFALEAAVALSNSGEMLVAAKAEAHAGTAASANATATGYTLIANNAELDFANSGEFAVIADASADGATGSALAHAIGFTAEIGVDGTLGGAIDNSGDLLVRAEAEVIGTGSAVAQATGFNLGSDSADLAVTNSGTILVEAVTSGGSAEATAIRFYDTGAATAGDGVIFTNDGGTIIARRSEDGGDTWLRGTAIDTNSAPSPVVINLLGGGSIYGNISLSDDDTINVTGGETSFDGIINPACLGGGCGFGTLNIGSDGALFLRHNIGGGDGPSAAYVAELNVAGDGMLIFELPAGAHPESAYPQVFADVANLDGALLVRSASGLYDDSYLFEDVIDANTRNGQFDVCGIDGNPALLELTCIYDAQGNVDLGIERIAFNAVDGLTRNQRSAGSGIEALYDVGLTGLFAEMVGQLFTFGADDYRSALDQLTGADYASYQQSFHALGNRYNQLIDKATECAMPQRAASALDCRTDKIRVWGQLDVGSRRNDGDIEAPGYTSDRWTAIIGADALVGDGMVVGASIAKVSDHADYRDGGSINADGYQLGAYATYDPGQFYTKVMGTLSNYDGDAKRRIDWSESGGDLQGQLRGDPDVRLLTLGLHAGYRVEIGSNSLLTPYANVDYSSVKLKDFTETGLAAADLSVNGSTSSRTTVAVGTKWAADLGMVIPQAELGYVYNFGDKRTAFDAAFLGDEDSRFEIISSAEQRGSLLAGLSLGGKAGPVNVRIGYQGLFNGDGATHNAGVRLSLPLGGK